MKNTQIFLAIGFLFGIVSVNAGGISSQYNRDDKATFLHTLARNCHFARVKCSVPDMLDADGIDPFIKDSNGCTAREIAIKKTGSEYCEYIAQELELYEKRYQEVMQQK
jgi:hypothetical protein